MAKKYGSRKRKSTQPLPGDSSQPLKRQRTPAAKQSGSLRVMSFNALGTDKSTSEQIAKFMKLNAVDLALIQEASNNSGDLEAAVSKEFGNSAGVIQATERPPTNDLMLPGYEDYGDAALGSTAAKSYAFVTAPGVHATLKPQNKYATNPRIRKYICCESSSDSSSSGSSSSSGTAARSSPRAKRQRLDVDRHQELGLRRPQAIEVNGMDIYNYHAPQGGGSNRLGSGRDAIPGNEMFLRQFPNGLLPKNTVLAGDLNLNRNGVKAIYGNQESVGGGGKSLDHAIAGSGVSLTKVKDSDVNGANDLNKHSDHNVLLFDIRKDS